VHQTVLAVNTLFAKRAKRLSGNTRFANFQSIVDASRFDLSNPIPVNSAYRKGWINQTPTLIIEKKCQAKFYHDIPPFHHPNCERSELSSLSFIHRIDTRAPFMAAKWLMGGRKT